MKNFISSLAIALGLTLSATAVNAFSVAPLSHVQQTAAKRQIQKTLPKGTKIESIKFGFGKTPTGFIGTGFEHATVKVKSGSTVKTETFTVSPGGGNRVNVWTPGK